MLVVSHDLISQSYLCHIVWVICGHRAGGRRKWQCRAAVISQASHRHTHRAASAAMMRWPCSRSQSCSHSLHMFTLMSPPPTVSYLCQMKKWTVPPNTVWINKQTVSSRRRPPGYELWLYAGALYLNLSTSASSTRKSLFCTSLWIFRISSSSRCLCFLVFSFSGGKGSRKIKKKTDKVINTYITGWLGHSDLKPSCITRELHTFVHLQLTRANWPYSKVSWLLNTESHPKQSLYSPPHV